MAHKAGTHPTGGHWLGFAVVPPQHLEYVFAAHSIFIIWFSKRFFKWMNELKDWDGDCFTVFVSICCPTAWMSHMYAYIYPLPFEPPCQPHATPLGHHRASRWAPCAVEQLPTSRLFYTRACIYVSPSLLIHPTLSFPRCAHKSVLCVCISIPALQIGSAEIEYLLNEGLIIFLWSKIE